MDMDRAVVALGALAQETRLQIFRILVKAGQSGLAAGTIAERLGIVPATLSFHLQQLTHADLIVKRRASRSLIYSVNARGMNALLEFLTEDCCDGRPELCLPQSACAPSRKTAKVAPAPKRSTSRR